jgi:hypothetical protein
MAGLRPARKRESRRLCPVGADFVAKAGAAIAAFAGLWLAPMTGGLARAAPEDGDMSTSAPPREMCRNVLSRTRTLGETS